MLLVVAGCLLICGCVNSVGTVLLYDLVCGFVYCVWIDGCALVVGFHNRLGVAGVVVYAGVA